MSELCLGLTPHLITSISLDHGYRALGAFLEQSFGHCLGDLVDIVGLEIRIVLFACLRQMIRLSNRQSFRPMLRITGWGRPTYLFAVPAGNLHALLVPTAEQSFLCEGFGRSVRADRRTLQTCMIRPTGIVDDHAPWAERTRSEAFQLRQTDGLFRSHLLQQRHRCWLETLRQL